MSAEQSGSRLPDAEESEENISVCLDDWPKMVTFYYQLLTENTRAWKLVLEMRYSNVGE